MTVGKDVSSLFTDVVNCAQTGLELFLRHLAFSNVGVLPVCFVDNLELKKLAYLYIMNYAKTQPDLAILAVNTFKKVKQARFFTNVPYATMLHYCAIMSKRVRALPFFMYGILLDRMRDIRTH